MSSSNCAVAGCYKPRHPGKTYCLDHHKSSDYSFGLDHELKQKMNLKYDVLKEQEVKQWIENVTKIQFTGSFQESLKSGVMLCNLVNKVKPGSVKNISQSKMPFSQRENIVAYLEAVRSLGMRESDLFVTQDLFEGSNIPQVIDSILAFGGIAQKVPGFHGPHLGVKKSDPNFREFTQAQLNEAKAVEPKQNAGSIADNRQYNRVDNIIKSNAASSSEPSRQNAGDYGYTDNTPRVGLDKINRNVIGNRSVYESVPQQSAPVHNLSQNQSSYKPQTAPANQPPPPKVPPPENVVVKNFCTNCGSKLTGGKFCADCGTPV